MSCAVRNGGRKPGSGPHQLRVGERWLRYSVMSGTVSSSVYNMDMMSSSSLFTAASEKAAGYDSISVVHFGRPPATSWKDM